MLPMTIKETPRIFPGNRAPRLEVICPRANVPTLCEIGPFSKKLFGSSPYGSAFGARVALFGEFAFEMPNLARAHTASQVARAEEGALDLCIKSGAAIAFTACQGKNGDRCGAVNIGILVSPNGVLKAPKGEAGGNAWDASVRAIEIGGQSLSFLVCYEATLEQKNTVPGQIALVAAYAFPAVNSRNVVSASRGIIVNDTFSGRACAEFKEGCFWTSHKGESASYFWLWE